MGKTSCGPCHLVHDIMASITLQLQLKGPSQLIHRVFSTLWLFQVSLLQRHLMSLTLSSSTARTSGIPMTDSLAILISEGGKKNKTRQKKKETQEEIKMLSNYFSYF